MPAISSFFQRYAEAYLDFDPHALKAFFALPCMIIDNRGDHMIVQKKDLLHYEKPFLDRLQKNGIQRIDAKMLADQPLTTDSSFCSVRYHFGTQHQKTLGDFEAHYVLVNDPDGWRIKFVKTGKVYVWDLEPV